MEVTISDPNPSYVCIYIVDFNVPRRDNHIIVALHNILCIAGISVRKLNWHLPKKSYSSKAIGARRLCLGNTVINFVRATIS